MKDPTETDAYWTAQSSYLDGLSGRTPDEQRELKDWRKFYAECSRKYGTSKRPFGEREYVALYVAQKGRCAICQKARGRDPRQPLAYAGYAKKPRRLAVDHNHLTGLVRGLLCSGGDKTCNRIIGWLDADALERGAAYMRRPPAVDVLSALVAGVPHEGHLVYCADCGGAPGDNCMTNHRFTIIPDPAADLSPVEHMARFADRVQRAADLVIGCLDVSVRDGQQIVYGGFRRCRVHSDCEASRDDCVLDLLPTPIPGDARPMEEFGPMELGGEFGDGMK